MNDNEFELELDVDLVPVILYIPNNAVSVEINARIIDENENICTAVSKYNMKELNDAKIEGEYWESENIKYTLTDKARRELKGGC